MNQKSSIKDFEDQYFKESHFSKMGGYELLTRLNLWRPRKYRKLILEHSNPNHSSLLDIGCAYGHFLDLLKNDFEVYGMDISNHAISVAKKRIRCDFILGNIEKEGIPITKKFDIITAISVLEHLRNPEAALKEILTHLNKRGLFCFEIPTISNKLSAIIYKLFFSHDDTHIYIKSVDEIEHLVRGAGFEKLASYSSLFPIFTKKKKFVDDFSFVFCIFQKF